MDITQIRNETAGCDLIVHLNNAGASLMPRPVVNAMLDYLTVEERLGGYETAERNAAELDRFYIKTAELLGCTESNIAFTTNATDGYNRALSSIDFKEGDVILTTTNDYPSNFIAFISLQKRFGVKVVIAKNTGTGEVDLEDLEKKIKQYLPRLLSVSHVPTSSGLVQPVEEIGKLIKNSETLFLLDACQSLGQMNIDVIKANADFLSGTFRKFLRGPRGAGLLYVSDRALSSGLEPLFPDLRGAEWTDANHYKPRKTAKRFEDWETAYSIMAGSIAAIDYLMSLGIGNIEKRNQELMAYLRSLLSNLSHIQILDKGKEKCNIVTLSINEITEKEAKAYFTNKGINIYTTPKSAAILDYSEKNIEWALRVSPHYYNTENEIDVFIDAVKAINEN